VEEGFGYEWLPKAIVYALGQLAIGVVVLRSLGSGAPKPLRVAGEPYDAWLRNYALLVSLLVLAAVVWRAWAHGASAFGPREAWLPENLRVIALESRWGEGWRLQLYAALAMNGAVLLGRVAPLGWIAFAASAVGLAVVMPLLGHAGGSLPRHVMHLAHNLAAALWLGTLGVMTTLGLWSRARSRTWHHDRLGLLVQRFSPLALGVATVVMVSGVCAAWVYLGSLEAMWLTAYGRILASKLAAVALVLVCGWTNWRRVRANQAPRLTWMTIEWICALLVVSVTGILTETEHP
jgi:putative copper export protein